MLDQNQYWYFLIAGQADDTTGIMGNFYAYGHHCGEALASALHAAIENNFINPEVTEASRLDTLEEFEQPNDLIQLSEMVLTSSKNYSYPLETSDDFIQPTGIVRSVDEGEFNYELIKECFMGYKNVGNDAFQFELITQKNNTIPTFIEAVNFLPSADSLELRIKGHWDNTETESWVNYQLDTKEDILKFLIENQINTIENGFVECIIKLEKAETTLVLNEHKKLLLQTTDESIFSGFGKQIIALGFEQVTELYSLEYGFYHWHYRPTESLPRIDLRVLLTNSGFELAESWYESNDEMRY